jgi:hypothetical protein
VGKPYGNYDRSDTKITSPNKYIFPTFEKLLETGKNRKRFSALVSSWTWISIQNGGMRIAICLHYRVPRNINVVLVVKYGHCFNLPRTSTNPGLPYSCAQVGHVQVQTILVFTQRNSQYASSKYGRRRRGTFKNACVALATLTSQATERALLELHTRFWTSIVAGGHIWNWRIR